MTTNTLSPDVEPTRRPKQKQIFKYLRCLFRLAVTALLLCCVVGLLRGFEGKGALTKVEKYTLNTLFTFLTIALGMNMPIAHSHVVNFIRDGIMKGKSSEHTDSEKDYRQLTNFPKITGLRSTFTVVLDLLALGTLSYPGGMNAAYVFFLIWLLLNLSLATAIALIGFTFSLEDNAIGHRLGRISTTNIQRFLLDNDDYDTRDWNDQDVWEERFLAKLYTDISITYPNTDPQNPEPDSKTQLEDIDGGWRYYFRQSDPARKVVTRSNRYIETTAICKAFRILSYDNSTSGEVVYDSGNGTTETLPEMHLDTDTAYFAEIQNKDDLGSDFTNCGPRCGVLNVTQVEDINNLHDAWLYTCQSTVNEVVGATELQQEKIDNRTAVIAAISLSLGSYDGMGRAYDFYPKKLRFGTFANGDPQKMAKIVSRGSAGCIAAMDEMNPRLETFGLEPWVGVQLKVRWTRLLIGAVIIFMVQLIISLCAILWHYTKCAGLESQPQPTSPEPPSDSRYVHSPSGGKMH